MAFLFSALGASEDAGVSEWPAVEPAREAALSAGADGICSICASATETASGVIAAAADSDAGGVCGSGSPDLNLSSSAIKEAFAATFATWSSFKVAPFARFSSNSAICLSFFSMAFSLFGPAAASAWRAPSARLGAFSTRSASFASAFSLRCSFLRSFLDEALACASAAPGGNPGIRTTWPSVEMPPASGAGASGTPGATYFFCSSSPTHPARFRSGRRQVPSGRFVQRTELPSSKSSV
mmetsp:Transcript_28172/g.81602  ORF Transcript_28172/g.81602 Transcript_28172/m.81602 type:complete len:239 (-) Transcript_28172:43-759(-)